MRTLLHDVVVEYITHSEAQGRARIDIRKGSDLAHGRDTRTGEAVTLRTTLGDLEWREIKP